MTRATRLIVPALAVGLAATGLEAQQVGAELAYHGISIGDASLTEIVFPVGVTYRLGNIRFDANTAIASASFEANGETSTLSGLTDINARVMLPINADRARIVIAANLPTGTSALAPAELPVAAALTTDLLTMPVTSFGSGAGVTTGLAITRPAGSWLLGAVGAYRVGSAYEPLVSTAAGQSAEFRPGDELRIRLAAQRPSDSGVSVRVAGTWSAFGSDQSDDVVFFDRGDRLLGEAAVEFPVWRGAALAYLWDLYRSEGSVASGFQASQIAAASNMLGAGVRGVLPLNPTLTLRPILELVLQSSPADVGPGEGSLFRLGTGVQRRVGGFILEPAVLAQFGSLDGESISGFVLRGGVAWAR